MARHIWTVLCTKASVDKQSNNVSLFDIIEKITISGAPQNVIAVLPIPLELAILWIRTVVTEPETGVGRFFVMAPNNQRFEGGNFAVELVGNFIRARSIVQMNGLPLVGPGIYEFVVEFQTTGSDTWSEASRIPLEVEYTDAPPASG